MVTFDQVTLLSNGMGYLMFLLIQNSNSVTFRNLLVKNNAASVIAINTVGSVTITECAFKNNTVHTPYGAVLAVVLVEHLTLTRTDVSDNTADYGFIFYLKDALIDISHSSFSRNTAYGCGPLYVLSMTALTVSDCTFKRNRATSFLAVGGAVAVDSTESGSASFTDCVFLDNAAQSYAGAILITYSVVSILRCSFRGNRANLGGAVFAQGTAVIDHSSFHANVATPVISDPLRYEPRGGAVFLINGTDCRVTNCTFSKNEALTYGGAIGIVALKRFFIGDCTITDNVCGAYGGGISVEGGNSGSGYTIQRTNITRNTALLHGGGIYFSPLNYFISTVSCVFSENRAIQGSGGAMYFERTCNKISIGGQNPKTLSIATASTHTIEDDFISLFNYYGALETPRASGYYVVFEAKTVLSGNRYQNGIKISGVDGLAYQGRQFWEYEHKHAPVTTGNDDIATWPGIGGNPPIFVNGNLLKYQLHELTDHYIFTAYPIHNYEPPNVFTRNTAALSGGAIYWGSENTEIFVMPGTLFVNNSATAKDSSGGAFFMHVSNSLIYIFSSTFISNKAYLGGAITLSQSNYPMSLYQCTFMNNHAFGYGGAIYLGDGNGYGFFRTLTVTAIQFFDAVFKSNTAAVSGGGAYVSNSNAMTFNNTVMTGNFANDSGGALHFEFKNIAVMNYTLLSLNGAARRGGAIQSSTGNSIEFNKLTLFKKNYADVDGGAISMTQASAVAFRGETSFSSNRAGANGGAILSSASTTSLGIEAVIFENNSAEQGSALRFESLISGPLIISPSNTTSITFLRNYCSGRGGTVSWVKEPSAYAATYDHADIPNFKRIVYQNNSAVFGSRSSTQATKLIFANKNSSLKSVYYAQMLPHLTVNLLDYFSDKDITDSTAIVTATVASYSCMGKVGYLSGVTAATVVRGDAQFTHLSAFCFPGGNMTLKYTGERAL